MWSLEITISFLVCVGINEWKKGTKTKWKTKTTTKYEEKEKQVNECAKCNWEYGRYGRAAHMLHFTLKMGNDAYCIFRLYKPKIKSSSACKKRLDPEKYRRLWNYSETKHKNPCKKCEREKMQRKKNNNSSGTNSRNEK